MTRKRTRLGAWLGAVSILAAGCASNAPQDTLKPEGKYSTQIANLINPIFGIAGVVFVLVLGGALLLSIKFRARSDKDFDEIPHQLHGNNPLEIGWTIIPAIVLIAVGVFSVNAIMKLSEPAGKNDLHVQVVGNQWWWEYRYDINKNGEYGDEGDVVTANDLVIPAGKDVELEVTSRDVIHSFWVPRLNGKRDAVPNRRQPWKIQADQPGEWVGQCTEFCGLSHAEMRIKAIALTTGDFESWVEGQLMKAKNYSTEDTSLEAEGYRVFVGQLCSSCHLIDGVNDKNFDDSKVAEFHRDIEGGPGTIIDPELQASRHAPNLTHLMTRTTFAGAKFNLRRDSAECEALGVKWADTADSLEKCLDRSALEAWIADAPAQKAMQPEPVEGRSPRRGMPNLNLTQQQIDQLIAYLTTLK